MMRAILVIFLTCTCQLVTFSQDTAMYHEAVYSVSFKESDDMVKDVIKALVFANVRYTVRANDQLYTFEGKQTGNTENEHLRLNQTGPEKIVLDLRKDILFFDNDKLQGYRYSPVHFTPTGKDSIIDHYKCTLLISSANDSLFVTKELSWSVNPFLLSSKSIPCGIVRAVLSNGRILRLLSYKKVKGKLQDMLVPSLTGNIKTEKNIYFPGAL